MRVAVLVFNFLLVNAFSPPNYLSGAYEESDGNGFLYLACSQYYVPPKWSELFGIYHDPFGRNNIYGIGDHCKEGAVFQLCNDRFNDKCETSPMMHTKWYNASVFGVDMVQMRIYYPSARSPAVSNFTKRL